VKKLLWCAVSLGVLLTGCSGGSTDTSSATPSATEFVAKADASDTKKSFTRDEMRKGFKSFKVECSKCHVGGQTYGTYNVKEINLSLGQLQGATPPLDNLATLVKYMRDPLSYDGTEKLSETGRHPQYTDKQISDETATLIAAHILKNANFNPTWGKGKDVR